MNRDNFLMGLILGAVIMLSGCAIGFWAGWHKHEVASMRVINEWLEKQIQKDMKETVTEEEFLRLQKKQKANP